MFLNLDFTQLSFDSFINEINSSMRNNYFHKVKEIRSDKTNFWINKDISYLLNLKNKYYRFYFKNKSFINKIAFKNGSHDDLNK